MYYLIIYNRFILQRYINGISLNFPSDIASLATVNLTETFIPKCHGPHKLLASLSCPQLAQVHGACNLVVREKWKGMPITKRVATYGPKIFLCAFHMIDLQNWISLLYKGAVNHGLGDYLEDDSCQKSHILAYGVDFWFHVVCRYLVFLIISFVLHESKLKFGGCGVWLVLHSKMDTFIDIFALIICLSCSIDKSLSVAVFVVYDVYVRSIITFHINCVLC